MTSISTIPVTVTPEAAERVAELGFQAQLGQMLDHARRTIPSLRGIEVVLVPAYDAGDEPGIVLDARLDEVFGGEDAIWQNWSSWHVAAFPPEVGRHFSLHPIYRGPHAG